jgi:hypothetical protein
LETQTPPGARSAKQNIDVPQGAGQALKRVTEGEQGKYGKDGALWKHPSEEPVGVQDAGATGQL